MAAYEFQLSTLRQDANLKGYWRMSSNSNDETGNHNGTDADVSYTTGKFGNASSFNGSSSKITLANPTANLPSGSGDRTILAWINPTSITNYGPIFAYGSTVGGQGWHWGWDGTNAKLTVGRYGANATPSSTTISTGTWSHVGIKYTGTSLTYYLNGATDGTVSFSSIDTTLSYARIGRAIPGWDAADGAYLFNGLIDDVVIFDRALTDQEVSDLYNGTGTTTSTSSSTTTTSTSTTSTSTSTTSTSSSTSTSTTSTSSSTSSSTTTTSTSTSTTTSTSTSSTSSSTSTTSTSSSTSTTSTSSSTSTSTTLTVTTTSTSTTSTSTTSSTTTSTSTTSTSTSSSTSSSTSTTSTSSSTSSSTSTSTTITKDYSFQIGSEYSGYTIKNTLTELTVTHGDK